MHLDAASRQAYAEQGYLLLERVLPPTQVDALVAAADGHAAGDYRNYLNLHRECQPFRELITSPPILAVADSIQGHRMIPIGSIFFFSKPGSELEAGSVWHQDNYAPKAPYGSYLVIGVALDDAAPENGSLVVFPRTHTLGDLPCEPSKNFEHDAEGRVTRVYPIGNPVAIPDRYEPQALTYPRGSLIVLHGHTIHGAPKNPHPTCWRRIIYLHFIKDGDPFWPGWNARRALVDRPDLPGA